MASAQTAPAQCKAQFLFKNLLALKSPDIIWRAGTVVSPLHCHVSHQSRIDGYQYYGAFLKKRGDYLTDRAGAATVRSADISIAQCRFAAAQHISTKLTTVKAAGAEV